MGFRLSALRILSIVLLLAVPLVAAAQTTVRPDRVGLSQERLARITAYAERNVEAQNFAGAVTLVARDGHIAHLEAHGYEDIESGTPMRTDTLFRIASMSKPVGTVAILMLIESGQVRLTDPVSRFLPEYTDMEVAVRMNGGSGGGPGFGPGGSDGGAPQFYTVPASRPINVLDLLTHTSGVMSGRISSSAGGEFSSRRHDEGLAWVDGLGSVPLEFQPGERWAYSALAGFDVLSRIVEIASGQSFDEFLDEHIFEPLGMRDTFFWPSSAQRERLASSYARNDDGLAPRPNPDSMSGPRYFSAAGGLMTTAADYARFAMMLANRGELDGARILSPRSVELMGSAYIPDTLAGRSAGESYGLGVRVVTDPAALGSALTKGSFGWSGLYGTHFWVDPEKNLIAILMAQTYFPNSREDFEFAVMQAVID